MDVSGSTDTKKTDGGIVVWSKEVQGQTKTNKDFHLWNAVSCMKKETLKPGTGGVSMNNLTLLCCLIIAMCTVIILSSMR